MCFVLFLIDLRVDEVQKEMVFLGETVLQVCFFLSFFLSLYLGSLYLILTFDGIFVKDLATERFRAHRGER